MLEPTPQNDEARMQEAVAAQIALQEIQRRLDRLERREWFTWWSVIVVMLLLLLAVVTVSFPELMREGGLFERFQTTQAIEALISLVLLFNLYTIWQQVQIRKLRRELSKKMEDVSKLQLEADEFYKLAVMDHLTGLFNRRFADERLATEVARARRHKCDLSVVCIDLDDFKEVNDKYGHAAGDLVLRQLADRLKKAVRTTDIVARMGGDEFLAILLECPPERTQVFLDRMQPFHVEMSGNAHTLNLSAGCAGYQEGDTAESILDRADRALYASKKAGKTVRPKSVVV
ncbi:MAG: GGDEF domain-containing protein [Acidobacteria bacterium]|nr:GGDEF domain-containing protein [Acidobacteriota bacterium]